MYQKKKRINKYFKAKLKCIICSKNYNRYILKKTKNTKFKINGKYFYYKSKFCSKKCQTLNQKTLLRGEKHHNWKGGLIIVKCKWCGKKTKKIKKWNKINKYVFCSGACRNRFYNKKTRNKLTDIELITRNILEKNNIIYIYQPTFIKISLPDFYLPKYHTFLFCDGDYWHKHKDRKQKDKQQNLKILNLGFKILRFWGTEIIKDDFEKKILNSLKKG